MIRFLLFFAVAHLSLFDAVSGASGQTASPPPIESQPLPAGPALNRAPAFAEWTMTYVYSDVQKTASKAEKKTPRISMLKVTKTNDIYHEEHLFSDGTQHESWHVGNMQIITSSEGKITMYDPSSFGRSLTDIGYNPETYTDYSKSDFPDLDWISSKTYLGVQKIKDTAYLIFQENPGDSLTLVRIDPETRLPFQTQNAQTTINYQFDNPPRTVQVLPPEIQTLLDKRAAVIRKLTTRVPSY